MFDGVLNAFLLSKNFEDNMTILYGCLILEENMINTLRFSRNLGSRSETFDSWNDSKIRETKNTFTIFRSSRPEVFCKKGVLKNFAKFTGKHLCQSLFSNKVAGLRAATLLKKRFWHRCFPMNFVQLSCSAN